MGHAGAIISGGKGGAQEKVRLVPPRRWLLWNKSSNCPCALADCGTGGRWGYRVHVTSPDGRVHGRGNGEQVIFFSVVQQKPTAPLKKHTAEIKRLSMFMRPEDVVFRSGAVSSEL